MTVTIEIDSNDATKIAIEAPMRYKELIKDLPGSGWSSAYTTWRVPLSWSSCIAARETFGDELVIGPGLVEWARKQAELLAYTQGLRTLLEPAPSTRAEELYAHIDSALFPHQLVDVAFLAAHQRALLFSEPGTGKSASVVSTLRALSKQGVDVTPGIIVCPASVKPSWGREFARWWPDVTVTVVDGTATKRRSQLLGESDFYVMNFEAIRAHSRLSAYGSIALKRCDECGGGGSFRATQCEVHQRELNSINFASAVVDEAHRIKDPSAKTSRAIMAATKGAQVRFALTGTPIASSALDLWSILHFIDPDQWTTRTKWASRFLDIMHNTFGGVVVSGLKAERTDEFNKTVTPLMRRVTKEAVLPFLPPVVAERRDVPMTPKQAKAYKEVSDGMIADLDSGTLVASSILTQTIRLTQLASAYGAVHEVATHDGTAERFRLQAPSSKIAAFMEDLEDLAGRTIAVFAVSKQLIMLLSETLTKAKVPHALIVGGQDTYERQRCIDRFQDGTVKLILVTIAAGGTGLTLTAADTMVFLQRSWSAIEMSQALARCNRIGSEIHQSITRIDYVAPGTIEERVIEALEGKGAAMEEIVRDRELLKEMLKRG